MFSGTNMGENIIKNMAKEIVRDCTAAEVSVTYDMAVYLVHLKFLIPINRIDQDNALNRNFTQSIVNECVQDILADSVSVNTLKMQAYSINKVLIRESLRSEHEENAWKKAYPLAKEILEMDPTDKDSRDKMYKKIVLFTIVFSGLGNPNLNSVFREAQVALHSVFKLTDMDFFLYNTPQLKEEQLVEFSRITSGIRLFNKDCQKGGDGIEDLPLLLTQASQITKDRINSTLEQLMKRSARLMTAFDEIYYISLRKIQILDDDFKYNMPPDFTENDLDKMKRIFYMIREHEYYLTKLLPIIDESIELISKLIERFRETLLQLHDTVRYRSAVPTVQVYPLFIVLSRIWEEMQQEANVLSEINGFISHLQSYNKYEEQTQLEILLGGDLNKVQSSNIVSSVIQENIDHSQLHSGVTVIKSNDEKLLEEAQFAGFCAWTLAVTDGLLVPGNAEVGFLQYQGRIYAFSSMLAAHIWGKTPDRFIIEGYKVARLRLELVKILNLYDDLYKIKNDPLSDVEPEELKMQSAQVQTEVHPIKSYIDPDYAFSIWELKRRALQLSRIINYQTKSQQTVNHSNFRRSIGLQMSPCKTQGTQTKVDKSCNNPPISTFIHGLRGHYDNKVKVLNLTEPLE